MRFSLSTLSLLLLVPASVVAERPAGAVTSFVLVDAAKGEDIMVLENNDVIKTQDVGTSLSIRAEATGLKCIEFNYDEGKLKRVDGKAPYYFAGNEEDKINVANSLSNIGVHTLTACPSNCALFAPPQSQRKDKENSACHSISFEVSNGSGGGALFVDFLEDILDTDAEKIPSDTFGILSGEFKQWHTLTLGLAGPPASEMGMTVPGAYRAASPFPDYKCDCTFKHEESGNEWIVPGYYNGNGNVHNDGSTQGGDWLCHFVPPMEGSYIWTAKYAQGTNVAQNGGGNPGDFFDGASGDFSIGPSDKTGADLRGKGRLGLSEGKWKFQGTGEQLLKMGLGSPSNLFAYSDFDDTPNNHEYRKTFVAHEADHNDGDPTWHGGKGKGLIGAINYLASVGVNVLPITLITLDGDDNNIFPFVDPEPTEYNFLRYDVSKLAQWNIVMDHAEKMGVTLDINLFDNDYVLDGGKLGELMSLYIREMVARYGHHLSVVWNIGTDISTKDAAQRSDYLRSLDPYNNPIAVRTHADSKSKALFQVPFVDTVVLLSDGNVGGDLATFGKGSPVTITDIGTALSTDAEDPTHDAYREEALYGAIFAGSSSLRYFFGSSSLDNDLTAQDFRTRASFFEQAGHAQEFLAKLPADMAPATTLVTRGGRKQSLGSLALSDATMSKIAIYKKSTSSDVTLDLSILGGEKAFSVKWFNPRMGGAMVEGKLVEGGRSWQLVPPSDPDKDWACLVECASNC